MNATMEAVTVARPETAAPPLAPGGLAALLVATLIVHLPALARYGWVRDALYCVSCAKRLAGGYVDEPPLSIALLAAWRAVAHDSLAMVRLVPLAAHLALVALTIRLAQRLGGGAFAQVLAGTGALA